MKLTTLDAVSRDGWIFKTSCDEETGVILLVAFHTVLGYGSTRFFYSEGSAANWIEMIVASSKELMIMRKDTK